MILYLDVRVLSENYEENKGSNLETRLVNQLRNGAKLVFADDEEYLRKSMGEACGLPLCTCFAFIMQRAYKIHRLLNYKLHKLKGPA